MANTSTQQVYTDKAFRKGLSELKVKDLPEVRDALFRILGITTSVMLNNYASGRVKTLDVEKARQIGDLFASYGVNDPWGL